MVTAKRQVSSGMTFLIEHLPRMRQRSKSRPIVVSKYVESLLGGGRYRECEEGRREVFQVHTRFAHSEETAALGYTMSVLWPSSGGTTY